MIPKYIFDEHQKTLTNLTNKEKLLNYRMQLYIQLKRDIFMFFYTNNKYRIINDYKIKVSEIDYKITILNKKEINKN